MQTIKCPKCGSTDVRFNRAVSAWYYRDAEGKVWSWRPRIARYIKVNHPDKLKALKWLRR